MFTSLINLFFPEVCAGCDRFLLSSENVICTYCRHALPLTNHHLTPNNDAMQMFYGKLPVEFVAALCYFTKKGIVQEIVHKLKYKSQEQIGTAIGSWLADDLKTIPVFKKIDAIIPVPLHKRRLRERGYNQVAAFGKALSENLEIPMEERLLVRNVYKKSQTKKNRAGRSVNNRAVFGINPEYAIPNSHYLLIDDVLTTGATLEACGRALQKIDGVRLSIICMAMTK